MFGNDYPLPIPILIASPFALYLQNLAAILSRDQQVRILGALRLTEDASVAEQAVGFTAAGVQVLVLDAPYDRSTTLALLAAWHRRFPAVKGLVVREGFDAGFIAQALGYGVRGFLLPTCSLAMYGKALRVIQAGDIWAGRKILAEVALNLLHRQAWPTQTSADGHSPAALAHLNKKRAPLLTAY